MRLLSTLIIPFILLTVSCSSPYKEDVESLLSKREQAIETKDVDMYMTLISPDYQVEDGSKVIGLDDVKKNFLSNVTLFDELELTSANRSIYERDGVIEVVQLTVVDALISGTSEISGGGCDGKSLALNNAEMLGSIVADDSGTAVLNVELPADYSGKTVNIQAYAEKGSTCGISNRVTQTIQSTPTHSPSLTLNSDSSNPILLGFTPNVAGENNSLTVSSVSPGATVFFKYSLNQDTKNRFKVNEKIHFSQKGGNWYIVKESDADFLESFVFGGSN